MAGLLSPIRRRRIFRGDFIASPHRNIATPVKRKMMNARSENNLAAMNHRKRGRRSDFGINMRLRACHKKMIEGRARHSVRADWCQPEAGAHGVTRPTSHYPK